jgi:hypothetical protein
MAVGAIGGSANSYALQAVRSATGQAPLTPEQQAEVQRLKAIDQKVRAHEAAHMSAGAGLTSGASYQYTRGPDGKQYAVAGEVKIDVSPAQTPSQTVDKAKRIQAAALAPADPSSQDRAVAAQAAQMAMRAQQELNRAGQEEGGGRSNPAIAAYVDQEPRPEPSLSVFA